MYNITEIKEQLVAQLKTEMATENWNYHVAKEQIFLSGYLQRRLAINGFTVEGYKILSLTKGRKCQKKENRLKDLQVD